ncbi:hypothetical protein [uncultured Sulfitobacter sp.]|uniref:hypothetical protein n=1 Tax=uncultured Sulfitobacter sp. TaxID=191468 RepID=UPI00262A267B|nr:hypothetical protein [uncultured Sulfitobacter sp.]
MTQILTSIPVWVPLLFIGLLVLGLRARHRRVMPVIAMYMLPFLSLLSLASIAALPAGGWIWGVFAIAFCAGGWSGFNWQGNWTLSREGSRIEVAGEPVTLFLLMTVFLSNFVLRFLAQVAPAVLAASAFQGVFGFIIGFVSGVFLGRALCVYRTQV